MNIGDRIKNRRKELGLSADDLAQKIRKDRATVYRYESKQIESLPITVLKPLAIALQTTEAYLMGWEEETKTEELTEHELKVIQAYRNNPKMQIAVDRLLGIGE